MQKKMRQSSQRISSTRRFLIAVLTLIIGAPTAAQSPPRQAATPALIPIAIGYPQTNYWPLFLARDLKLFEQAGLQPTFSSFGTGAPLVEKMKSNQLDVSWTGLATIFMLDKQIPLRFVMVAIDHSSQMSMLVNPHSGITSYRDLKQAHAIGAPAGTCSEVSAILAAKKAGMQIAGMRMTNLAPNLLLGALQNNQIDSAFIWGPWDLQLRDAGFKVVSMDHDYVPGGSVCGVTLAVRPEFLEQYPDAGCRLVKVQALALEAARLDPDKAIRVLQKETGLSYELAKQSYQSLAIPSIESQLDPKSTWSLTNQNGGLAKKLALAADTLYENKSFAKPVLKDTIWHSIDANYVKQYLETGCKL